MPYRFNYVNEWEESFTRGEWTQVLKEWWVFKNRSVGNGRNSLHVTRAGEWNRRPSICLVHCCECWTSSRRGEKEGIFNYFSLLLEKPADLSSPEKPLLPWPGLQWHLGTAALLPIPQTAFRSPPTVPELTLRSFHFFISFHFCNVIGAKKERYFRSRKCPGDYFPNYPFNTGIMICEVTYLAQGHRASS